MLRCRGKSYLDLLAQRAGDCEHAPDAVVAPADHDQVLAVLQACAEAGVAVVPFGGGTSVVGGLEPLRGPFEALISLDLGAHGRAARRRRALAHGDLRARRAAAGGRPRARRPRAHARAPAAELRVGDGRRLRRHPLGRARPRPGTAGSTRTSSPCASRRRSASWRPATRRPSAAGPELRQLVAGSEGVLGVITAATLRVHRLPAAQRFEGWLVRRLRGRLRGAAAARAGRRRARRRPAVGPGRDPLHARARRRRPDRAPARRRAVPDDPRLGRPVTPPRRGADPARRRRALRRPQAR